MINRSHLTVEGINSISLLLGKEEVAKDKIATPLHLEGGRYEYR
jgi:hypothetical protein